MIATMRGIAAIALLVACYSGGVHPGSPCPDGVCPAGLVCSPASHTCELVAVDAAGDGVPRGDAASDARADAAPGHLLVMIGAATHGPIDGISGGGVTWTRATSSTIITNIEIWFGITDGSSSTISMTMATNGNRSIWLVVTEWSGMATANILDVAQASSGISSPAATGGVTTTNAHDLIIFGIADGAPSTIGTPIPGNWTGLVGNSNAAVVQLEWYAIESATGTLNPHVSETANMWDAAIAAFRLAQ
jgi:hypothetical protein